MPTPMNAELGLTTMPENLPLLIDIPTAAALATVSESHIRVLCRKGEIKAVKSGEVWRINRDAYLQQIGLA